MTQHHPQYRPELRGRAAALYRNGMSIREVADAMDLSYTRVRELLEDAGVKMRRRGRLRKKKLAK